jgi:Cysteine-rich secretory protein family
MPSSPCWTRVACRTSAFAPNTSPSTAQAAEYSERALAFCNEAFAGYKAWPPKRALITSFVYYKSKATWVDVVRKNSGRGGEDVEFTIQNANSTVLGAGKDMLHAAGIEQEPTVYDFAVRMVAQQYSMLNKAALMEGVGHAIVGMFFGRNLIFNVGQTKTDQSGTVSGTLEPEKFRMPDLESWKDLAVELAWQKSSTPAAQLPLIKVSQFTSEQRIKAWSFCDYLLRRDPTLLLTLDRVGGKARTQGEVVTTFAEATKIPLSDLEEGWRQFWTGDTPVLRAIRSKVTPLEAASKEAPAWLETFNKLRKQHGGQEVGWSSSLSTDCKMHAEYLKKNKGERGPDKEFTEQSGKPGFTVGGKGFAERSLVWTKDKDPRKAMAGWLDLPGYRDAILNRNIDTVGLYAEGGIMVMDPERGIHPTTTPLSAMYPYVNTKPDRYKEGVPSQMDVAELGPDVALLLQAHGRGKQKTIGYPISLHLYTGNTSQVTCSVTINGQEVKGVLVSADAGHNRRTSAPGLWVFYPLDPLRKGVDIVVDWKVSGKDQKVTFMAN